MSLIKLILASALAFLLTLSLCFATDDYKPYLHNAKMPESPVIRLFGQYATSMFPGAATYTYPVEVPKGVNGLQPVVFLSYNSQKTKTRPGIVGAGWSLNQDLIYRDVNFTPGDSSDDKYLLVLDNNLYELIYFDGMYHTEVDYWFRIENFTDYWLVTKQDGTQYRFGYNNDSRLESNNNQTYAVKWFLDQVQDTHSNRASYSYAQDPNPEDVGAVYLLNVSYGSGFSLVTFDYETSSRPDLRLVYEQGNLLQESRRLVNINVSYQEGLVRKYELDYNTLGTSSSTMSSITLIGNDGLSELHSINFDYYRPSKGYINQTSDWISPVLFTSGSSDQGVRFMDINNDGLMDFAVAKSGTNQSVWINNKNSGWSPSYSFTIPFNFIDGSGVDQGVRTADINRDGFEDLVLSKEGYSTQVYLNNGSNWTLVSWNVPVYFTTGSGNDNGTLFSDVNGDGYADIVKSKDGTRAVYLGNGSGWKLSDLEFPTDILDSSGSDQGARLLDVNGDGLVDVIKSTDKGGSYRAAWINNGSGWANSTIWVPPSTFYFTQNGVPDTGVRFVDLDGDGLVDMLQDYSNGSTNTAGAWINNGSGWEQDNSWDAPVPFTSGGQNIGRRLADVDGDGFPDILISNTGDMRTFTKNATNSYSLMSIVNEYGGSTNLTYGKSTQFTNSENGTSNLGFNVFVVSLVQKDNGLDSYFGVLGNTSYSYAYGKFDYNKSEFRGFGLVVENKSDGFINHFFHQDNARRGKEYQTAHYSYSGNLLRVNVKDYNYSYFGGVYNLSLASSTDYLYEGDATPRILKKKFDYNVFGNPQFTTDYGDVDVSGDEKYINYSYGFNFNDWIVNKVSRITIYGSDFNKASETSYYYDNLGFGGVGSYGDLTKTENWVESGNNTRESYGYDDYGNLIQKEDPLGNRQLYVYGEGNTYLQATINALGYVTRYSYDCGTGNLNWQEENGIRTSFDYDTFGRLVLEIRPYDSEALPTKKYIYSFDGEAPETVLIGLRTTGSESDNISYYYDGFANLVQVKRDLKNETDLVKNFFYDGDYRIGSEQVPYFAAHTPYLSDKSSEYNETSYDYDALGRVIGLTNPDGSSRTVGFGRYNITDYDENGHAHKYLTDGAGRITEVYELVADPFTGIDDSYQTSYDYDANDNLIEITDNEGNDFRFYYDSLSRKTGISDPDLGNWTYTYDSNGNLILQSDSRGKNITLSYDALNRVVSKIAGEINLTLYYDEQFAGTLSRVVINSDQINYTYDDRFRIVDVSQSISSNAFDERLIYDSQDRILQMNGLNYTYSARGLINSIAGYLDSASFNAFGSPSSRTYQNGISTNYAHDQANNRLLGIASPGIQSIAYSYDAVGNIISINDSISGRMQSMSYDYLDRLVNATVGADSYIFNYNSIGNIKKLVENNVSKKYIYSGNQAHAPSTITDSALDVDLYEPHELDTQLRSRVFEFYLVNQNNNSVNTSFSVSFGDGSSFDASTDINASDSLVVLVENNYTYGGSYSVKFSAGDDSEKQNIRFGANAESLEVISAQLTDRVFGLTIGNSINEVARNVNWSCSQELSLGEYEDISGLGSIYSEIEYNYSLPGDQVFSCEVTSLDGNSSISVGSKILGLAFYDYDVLYQYADRRITYFAARNEYQDLEVNLSIADGVYDTNSAFNISSNDEIFAIIETEYPSPGSKSITYTLASNATESNYTDNFRLRTGTLFNYSRSDASYNNQTISFIIENYWTNGTVSWSVTNPASSYSKQLATEERNTTRIESNFSTQGRQIISVNVTYNGLSETITDFFNNEPLSLKSFDAALSGNRSVYELVVKNSLEDSQTVNWRVDTGTENISSQNLTDIAYGNDLIVLVEYNYSSGGIYQPVAFVNSTSYNDTEQRVVVI